MSGMYAIVTVTGADRTGIIAAVATALAEKNVNILDASQTLMDQWFTMILRVETQEGGDDLATLQKHLDQLGERESLVIRIQSEALFSAVNEI